MVRAPWSNDLGTRVLATLAGVAFTLAGLIGLGHAARRQLGAQERYLVSFSQIDCPTPPGTTAREFLDEVQYLGGMPEQLNILDDDLADRLTEAFGRHPRVAGIERIHLGSPKQIRVQLRLQGPQAPVR